MIFLIVPKSKPDAISTVAYIRVSTGRQVDEGNSIDSQQQKIMDYALQDDPEFVQAPQIYGIAIDTYGYPYDTPMVHIIP